jgi:predicted acetyltransferase
MTTTAPHLTGLELSSVSPERLTGFVAAAVRGFHADPVAELVTAAADLMEPERCFGFTAAEQWVATCAAWGRTLSVPGATVPVAAVSYVTVAPSFRRRGLLRAMMQHQLADVVRRGREPVALLWASEAPIYGRFGYGPAVAALALSGPTSQTAFRPEVDLGAGSVGEVDAATFRRVAPALRASLVPVQPGRLDRSAGWWHREMLDPESQRGGAHERRYALHHGPDGTPDGWVWFRIARKGWEPGEVRVGQLDGATPQAVARLWRFVLDLDLIGSFTADTPVDGPLLHLLLDPGSVKATLTDATYVRLVDVPGALQARRYAAPLDLVLAVRDEVLPANAGTVRVQVDGDGGCRVTRVSTDPDVSVGVRELGAVYLGGPSASALHGAGLLTEHTPGAARAMSAAFGWSRQPFADDHF